MKQLGKDVPGRGNSRDRGRVSWMRAACLQNSWVRGGWAQGVSAGAVVVKLAEGCPCWANEHGKLGLFFF